MIRLRGFAALAALPGFMTAPALGDETWDAGKAEVTAGGSAAAVGVLDVAAGDVAGVFELEGHLDVSWVSEAGLEYGVGLQLRVQKDRFRQGFGGHAGDCPPGAADCLMRPAVVVGALNRFFRGAAGRFFGAGGGDDTGVHGQLEDAYIFIRGGYGELILGREEGAAALLAARVPGDLELARIDGAPADLTGLAGVKTKNDASGFAAKVVALTPRVLGFQAGISYAPETTVCGVDYCARELDLAGGVRPAEPELDHVVEAALSFEHRFDSGFGLEASATAAFGSEDTGLAIYRDYEAYSAALVLSYGRFSVGASGLSSNNAVASSGAYEAVAASAAYAFGDWTLAGGYGASRDVAAHVDAETYQASLGHRLSEAVSLSAGVQRAIREEPFITGLGRRADRRAATAIFAELALDF